MASGRWYLQKEDEQRKYLPNEMSDSVKKYLLTELANLCIETKPLLNKMKSLETEAQRLSRQIDQAETLLVIQELTSTRLRLLNLQTLIEDLITSS